MKNSKVLWAERNELARTLDEAVKAGNEHEALIIQGKLDAKNIEIEDAIESEDALRSAPKAKAVKRSLAEHVLGARDEFAGVEVGFKNVVHIGGTTETDFEVPWKLESPLAGFANTLRWVPSEFDAVKYLRRSTQTGTPAGWAGVTDGASATKAAVSYEWVDVTANMETFAGYVPVSKQSLRSYDELHDVIEHDLVLDVSETIDAAIVNGNNPTGVVGIVNTVGIQEDETGYSGDYYTAIRHLKTLVVENGRRVPTHVCVSPEIMEALDVYKTQDGYFQNLGSKEPWGMEVVEDANIDGILVYDANSAKVRYKGDMEVEVGYVNNQFIQNELTILAERPATLEVRYPASFAYITKANADAAPTEPTEPTEPPAESTEPTE